MSRVQPAVRGLLRVEHLLELREAVRDELVAGVRSGADQRTLRSLISVLDLVDQRVEHRSAMEDRAAANRQAVAATKAPTMRGHGNHRS